MSETTKKDRELDDDLLDDVSGGVDLRNQVAGIPGVVRSQSPGVEISQVAGIPGVETNQVAGINHTTSILNVVDH